MPCRSLIHGAPLAWLIGCAHPAATPDGLVPQSVRSSASAATTIDPLGATELSPEQCKVAQFAADTAPAYADVTVRPGEVVTSQEGWNANHPPPLGKPTTRIDLGSGPLILEAATDVTVTPWWVAFAKTWPEPRTRDDGSPCDRKGKGFALTEPRYDPTRETTAAPRPSAWKRALRALFAPSRQAHTAGPDNWMAFTVAWWSIPQPEIETMAKGGVRFVPHTIVAYLSPSMRLPTWQQIATATPAHREAWNRFRCDLVNHESGHLEPARKALLAALRTIETLEAADAAQLTAAFERVLAQIEPWAQPENNRYDRETCHGPWWPFEQHRAGGHHGTSTSTEPSATRSKQEVGP